MIGKISFKILGILIGITIFSLNAYSGTPPKQKDKKEDQKKKQIIEVTPPNNRIDRRLEAESEMVKKLFGKPESDRIYKVVIDDFEHAGEWRAIMPREWGIIKSRVLRGAPPQKMAQKKSLKSPKLNEYVLGVKVKFEKRGHYHFAIQPSHPIFIEGKVKAFEIWVVGRNRNHKLYILVRDMTGALKKVYMGRLNFLGWKRLFKPVPPGVIQEDFRHSPMKRGLYVVGLYVECDPLDTFGTYYIYFDDLTAEVSRFFEEYRSNPPEGQTRDMKFRMWDFPDNW